MRKDNLADDAQVDSTDLGGEVIGVDRGEVPKGI